MSWDNRHHVGGAPQKPLPIPPKIKALHGGPIKPKIDMTKPTSMTVPRSRHNKSRRPQSSHNQNADSELLKPVLKADLQNEHFRLGATPPDKSNQNQQKYKTKIKTDVANGNGNLEITEGGNVDNNSIMAARIASLSADLEVASREPSVVALAQKHAASTSLQRHQNSMRSLKPPQTDHKASEDIEQQWSKDVDEDQPKRESKSHFLDRTEQKADSKDQKEEPDVGVNPVLRLDVAPEKTRDKSRSPSRSDKGLGAAEDLRDETESGGGFGLMLDIGSIKKEAVEKTRGFENGGGAGWVGARASGAYELSASGTFVVDKFTIRREGTVRNSQVALGDQANLHVGVSSSLVNLGVLGHGASSVVHKALHVPTLRLVAVKKISVFDDAKRHQMVRELRALHRNKVSLMSVEWGEAPLDTPSCACMVSFFDAYTEMNEGAISLVMEYMDGGSIQDIVDTGGCADEGVLANISYRCLHGLGFLHSNRQIHRDIKPGNLLINHQGHVKVSDFGIVREVEDSAAVAETFVGTFTYMSPERIGGLPYSFNSDIWALGLSLLTCALGVFPYDTSGGYWGLLNEIKTKAPRGLKEAQFSEAMTDFFLSCLERDPELVLTPLCHSFSQHMHHSLKLNFYSVL